MDGDDRTPPERFRRQIDFIESHPEITVVGGWHRMYGGPSPGEPRTIQFPTDPGHLKAAMLFRNTVSHPTVMMRHDAFRREGWRYTTTRRFPEDYDLWVRVLERHAIANLPEVLLDYRIWPGSVCQQDSAKWHEHVSDVQARMLSWIGVKPTVEERAIHHALAFDQIPMEGAKLMAAHEWLMAIQRHNERTPRFETKGLMRTLTGRYIALVKKAAAVDADVYDRLMGSPFRAGVEIPLPPPP